MRKNQVMCRRRRSGAVLIYVSIAGVAMMALCSLAVDLGRYEFAHSSMYNAAVAAARAGASALGKSGATTTTITSAVNAVATSNTVDGQPITTSMVTIQYIKWTDKSNFTVESAANFSQANAIRVYVSYNVPLTFAQIIGLSSKQAVEHSTAEVITQVATPFVYASGDVWLAGEPAGTNGSQADPNYTSLHAVEDHQYPYDIAGPPGTNTNGTLATTSNYSTYQPYSSPIQVGFTVTPGATITITNTSGTASYDHDTAAYLDPTGTGGGSTQSSQGNAAAHGIAEHGISDASMPLEAHECSVLGQFAAGQHRDAAPRAGFQHTDRARLCRTSAEASANVLRRRWSDQFFQATGNRRTAQCDPAVHGNNGRMGMEQQRWRF